MKGLLKLLRRHAIKTSIACEQQTRALALQASGMLYYQQGQYAAAVPCLESALSLWTVLGNFQAEQRLFQWLGSCYWNLGQVQDAYCCYKEALTLARALSESPVGAVGCALMETAKRFS